MPIFPIFFSIYSNHISLQFPFIIFEKIKHDFRQRLYVERKDQLMMEIIIMSDMAPLPLSVRAGRIWYQLIWGGFPIRWGRRGHLAPVQHLTETSPDLYLKLWEANFTVYLEKDKKKLTWAGRSKAASLLVPCTHNLGQSHTRDYSSSRHNYRLT